MVKPIDVDEIRSRDAAVGDAMLLGMVHDLRRMLAVIASGISVTQEAEKITHGSDLARGMRQAVVNAGWLTNDIEMLARNVDGSDELIDIAALIERVADTANSKLSNKVRVSATAETKVWPVRASRRNMEFALLQLVANAAEAMDQEGSIVLSATNMPSHEYGPDHVRIEVVDQGCGIAPDIMKRVFEPFFTTIKTPRRAGLGLTHVLRFALECGGSADLKSSGENGTRAALKLPRARTRVWLNPQPSPVEMLQLTMDLGH